MRSRGGPGGQPSRFEHHDPSALQPRLVQQAQRHDGRLAGSRRGLEHGVAGGARRVAELPDAGLDRRVKETGIR